MNSEFEYLFVRRPVLNYVCPPVCETFFSGSGSPTIVLGDFSSLPAPGGVRFGGQGGVHLLWNAYPGALCFNIYRAESDVPDAPLVLIVECFPGTDRITDEGCYRISAITPEGESALSDLACRPFIPGLPPEVTTEAATDIFGAAATLNGTINALGQNSTAQFEWGTMVAYGNVTPLQDTGNALNAVPFNATISGLNALTTYHYRAIGSNDSGVGNGADMLFVTQNNPCTTFWCLEWTTQLELIQPGADVTKTLLSDNFYLRLYTPEFSTDFSRVAYRGEMRYTGPARPCHLHLVVNQAGNAISEAGVGVSVYNGIEFINPPGTGNFNVTGVVDWDFVIPESDNALILVDIFMRFGFFIQEASLEFTGTLT